MRFSAKQTIGVGWVSALALAGGCGGGRAAQRGPHDERPSLSRLLTVGPRCQDGPCRCREVDANGATVGAANEGASAEGQKRFELRTGRGADDVQITVQARGLLHKSGDTVEATCGYIDLPPGEHRVHLRVKAPAGQVAAPRMFIYEYGAQTNAWYGSFALSCGGNTTCTREELADRMAELQRPHGIFDPCGSVKVSGLRYDAQRDAEDRVTELDLDLTLKVYPFSPRFPPGGKCKGLSAE